MSRCRKDFHNRFYGLKFDYDSYSARSFYIKVVITGYILRKKCEYTPASSQL